MNAIFAGLGADLRGDEVSPERAGNSCCAPFGHPRSARIARLEQQNLTYMTVVPTASAMLFSALASFAPPSELAPATDPLHTPALGPLPTPEHIERVNRIWRGVGIGFDMGFWGQAHLAQSLKVDIPFGWRIGQFFGLRVRGIMVYTDGDAGLDSVADPVFDSGLELFGRGPVLFGLLRVYGGGGAWVGARLHPSEVGRVWRVGGGGHFGVEFAIAPRASLQLEFGGQAPGHALGYDAGASAMAGVMVYTGRAKPRA